MVRPESDSEEENEKNDLLREHVKVVDAFDEILNELENVRISMPKTDYSLRPSTVRQRPQSAYMVAPAKEIASRSLSTPISKTPRPIPEMPKSIPEMPKSIPELPKSVPELPLSEPFLPSGRDSGYLSTHNSQSSEIEDEDIESEMKEETSFDQFDSNLFNMEKRVFEIVNVWSEKFTGDLHSPETLHILMAILENLREKRQVKLKKIFKVSDGYRTFFVLKYDSLTIYILTTHIKRKVKEKIDPNRTIFSII